MQLVILNTVINLYNLSLLSSESINQFLAFNRENSTNQDDKDLVQAVAMYTSRRYNLYDLILHTLKVI